MLVFLAAGALSVNAFAGKHLNKKAGPAPTTSVVPGPGYDQRLDAMQAADDMAQRRDLDPA
ncbi:MAG TPA: lytic murein transglycosylase B, partial [Rhodoferax sp.]|nr:lytic murein transglycosylase B [Rhodoferax sp.]